MSGRYPTLEEQLRRTTRSYLVMLLTITRGRVMEAAEIAGRNRTEFYRLLGRHGLKPRAFRPPAGMVGQSGRHTTPTRW